MNEYEISLMYEEIEMQLMKNLKKTLERYIRNHSIDDMSKKEWNRFQVEALRGLEEFKKNNKAIFKEYSPRIQQEIEEMMKQEYSKALNKTEKDLMDKMKKGIIPERDTSSYVVNDKKFNALLNEITTTSLKSQEYAILRAPLDKYRQIIGSAQLYMNTGAGSLWECVDMATTKFLENGICTIQYKNGANVNIASYSEMALRTANTRATHQGEADMRSEWGENLVMVSSYGACSPICLPWQGRIYFDDVYGNGKNKTKYPLLSDAIAGGLYHPNCRHTHNTYYEGFSEVKEEQRSDKEISDVYKAEQQQRAIERELRKTKRLRDNCLTDEEKAKLNKKINRLNAKMRTHINDTNDKFGKEVLRRDRARESNLYKGKNVGTLKTETNKKVEKPINVVETPKPNETPKVVEYIPTQQEKNAIEYYVSGDGMFLNDALRERNEFSLSNLTENELKEIANIESATNHQHNYETLWRSVDATAIFGDIDELLYENLVDEMNYKTFSKSSGSYSQSVFKQIEDLLNKTKGKEIFDNGFMSTTKDIEVALDFGGFTGSSMPVVLEFVNANKINGFDLGKYMPELNEMMEQEEVLLHNKAKYEILDITTKNGSIYIKAKFK